MRRICIRCRLLDFELPFQFDSRLIRWPAPRRITARLAVFLVRCRYRLAGILPKGVLELLDGDVIQGRRLSSLAEQF